MTRAIKKWTTSHESSRRARFLYINSFFLEVLFGLQKPKGPLDGVYHCQNFELFLIQLGEIFHLVLFFLLLHCRFWIIHSLNIFLLLVRVCVSILSLPTERYKSKDISIMIRAIKKWTTSHESSQRARFHHMNTFSLTYFLACKNPKSPWMVSTTVEFFLILSNTKEWIIR